MLPLWGAPSSSMSFSGPEIPVYFGPFNSGGRVLSWGHVEVKLFADEMQRHTARVRPRAMFPQVDPLIAINGEPGNRRLRRLSKCVKPRQATFPDTQLSIRISGGGWSGPSGAFFHQSRSW